MRKLLFIILVSVFASTLLASDLFAEVINKRCPVTGNEISKDTPFTTEYEGKTIGFCCGACPAEFEKNPEKYYNKIIEEQKEIDEGKTEQILDKKIDERQ